MPLTLPAAADEALVLGVNRVNLSWLSANRQDEILDQIAGSGVHAVRLNVRSDQKASVETIRRARSRGLRVLLAVSLNSPAYFETTAAPRPPIGRFGTTYKLSDLSPTRFTSRMRKLLQELDRENLVVEAIEVGNEINWADFNGDFAVGPPGLVTDHLDDPRLDNSDQIKRGFKLYAAAVHELTGIVQQTALNAHARVITAGMADVSADWARRTGGDALTSAFAIDFLRQSGLGSVVQGFGVHLYPTVPKGATYQISLDEVARKLRACAQPDRAVVVPCWITEWGLPSREKDCSPDGDLPRQRAAAEMLALFRRSLNVQGAFYYDWDSSSRSSIWRCGSLLPSGKTALGLQRIH